MRNKKIYCMLGMTMLLLAYLVLPSGCAQGETKPESQKSSMTSNVQHDDSSKAESTNNDSATLYACPMRCTDDTFTDPEARCPICGMKVKPIAEQSEAKQIYACPMHPEEHSTDPNARCSICGMDLKLVDNQDANKHDHDHEGHSH